MTIECFNVESLSILVARWEAGTLPPSAWTHAAHVAVCAWYAAHPASEPLLDRMRRGIRNYNAAVGTVDGPDRGYHETLTRFWCEVIDGSIRERDLGMREVIARFGADRRYHERFYSFDVVRSRDARAAWVPPDRELEGLPAGFSGVASSKIL